MPTKQKEASGRIWLSLLELPWEEGRLEVRREMQRLGITLDDLAYKLRRNGYAVSGDAVKKWMRGERKPRYDGVREIVLVLAAVSAGDSPKGRQSSQLHVGYAFQGRGGRSYDVHRARPKGTRQAISPRKSAQAA